MKNKQKAWRKVAAQMKRDTIAEGLHTKGRRYGKWAKELHTQVQPFVSSLFLALRAKHFKETVLL